LRWYIYKTIDVVIMDTLKREQPTLRKKKRAKKDSAT
jgi:hypothetical protein